VIEAVMLWNEPNNKSHWDPEVDPDWNVFAEMTNLAGRAIKRTHPDMPRVLGGISPIDPNFIRNLEGRGVLDNVDVLAVHGFPLDWNLWQIDAWPDKLAEIQGLSSLPVWVTEVGASSFGAEEVQSWALQRTVQLLERAPRIHWYSLYDLPRAWEATTRHKEAEGSSYYRHFYMGLLREDGAPKPALEAFGRAVEQSEQLGLCQWFHFNDERLADAVAWMKRLGVRYLRTGLSWADSFRPGALEWFDRQMTALQDFDVTLTFCYTPAHLGRMPHHTSAPRIPEQFAEFCVSMLNRYARVSLKTGRVAGSAGDAEAVNSSFSIAACR
jgi:beta-xylosidase